MARRRRWNIVYIDGTEEEIAIGLRQVVEIERKWDPREFIAGAPQVQAVAFAAFLIKGGQADDAKGFDAFLDGVEDIEPLANVADDEASVDPSPPVAGDA